MVCEPRCGTRRQDILRPATVPPTRRPTDVRKASDSQISHAIPAVQESTHAQNRRISTIRLQDLKYSPGNCMRNCKAPHAWRAPEGSAAVPVGGGGAWPGFETTRRAKLAARTASGRPGRPRGGRRSVGGTSDNSRNYSPARRSTSCMTRPHTALTHATAATPRTRERQGRICRKSSKP